jgi:hypothetical protein
VRAIVLFGAGEESRTPDLRITNALLYQLSYAGVVACSVLREAQHYSRRGHLLPSQCYGRGTCAGTVIPSSASMPFHMICTPMHSRMNADSRTTTAVPAPPRNFDRRSA